MTEMLVVGGALFVCLPQRPPELRMAKVGPSTFLSIIDKELSWWMMKSAEDEAQPSRRPRWSSYSSDVLVPDHRLGSGVQTIDNADGFRRNTHAFEGEPQRVAVDIRTWLHDVREVEERLCVRRGSFQESNFLSDLRTDSSTLFPDWSAAQSSQMVRKMNTASLVALFARNPPENC